MINPKFLSRVSFVGVFVYYINLTCAIDRFFHKPLSLAAFGDAQSYKQHFRQEITRVVKKVENLIVEEYGTLDDSFRVRLWVLAQQSHTEALASLATPKQVARHATATPRKATSPDRRLAPVISSTNTDTATKEFKTAPPAIIQELKKGVEVASPRKAEAFDTSSLNIQENRSNLARDKDITPQQATSKSMLQGSAKKFQNHNPFRINPMSSSHPRETLYPAQIMQIDNGAGLNFPNSDPTLPSLPPMYPTSTLRETENIRPPSGTLPSTPSLNPFVSQQQSWDHQSSPGSIQTLSQDNMDSQWLFESDWNPGLSEGDI
jgi:hypothetical protein